MHSSLTGTYIIYVGVFVVVVFLVLFVFFYATFGLSTFFAAWKPRSLPRRRS